MSKMGGFDRVAEQPHGLHPPRTPTPSSSTVKLITVRTLLDRPGRLERLATSYRPSDVRYWTQMTMIRPRAPSCRLVRAAGTLFLLGSRTDGTRQVTGD